MIYLAIFGISSIPFKPSSLHANVLEIGGFGGIKVIPKTVKDGESIADMGCCDMYVFMAGAEPAKKIIKNL